MDIGPVRRRLTAEPISSPVPGDAVEVDGSDDVVSTTVPGDTTAPDDSVPQPAR